MDSNLRRAALAVSQVVVFRTKRERPSEIRFLRDRVSSLLRADCRVALRHGFAAARRNGCQLVGWRFVRANAVSHCRMGLRSDGDSDLIFHCSQTNERSIISLVADRCYD